MFGLWNYLPCESNKGLWCPLQIEQSDIYLSVCCKMSSCVFVVSVWEAGNVRIMHILLNLDSSVFTPCLQTLNTTRPTFYIQMCGFQQRHDDIIKWNHVPCCWPFVRGIHRSPVNYPHKVKWHGALMFSLICAWINAWVNNREASNLRRHRVHYDVIVMKKRSMYLSLLGFLV